ncbi:MAG TPA: DUF1254 domain-containing protein [Caulobacteraceae bacterium]|jgi:hypothetical protein
MPDEHLDRLKAAAHAAWLYALPLIEIATTRQRGQSAGARMNAFGHMRRLADHTSRGVTTPNNDTFYSTAQIDLSAGAVSIHLPPSGERYLSLALMDAYTNNFAVLGTRTTGGDGGVFTLIGPREPADGPNVVRSPTDHVWALARILVESPDDAEAAKAVQHGLSMQGPAVEAPGPFAGRAAPWQDYFASAARLLALNPPPVTDRAMLQTMAPLDLADFDAARFSAGQAAAIEAGVAEAKAAVRRGGGLAGGAPQGGWSYPDWRLGEYGQAYGFRASVALSGLAALPPVEAMYMRAAGPLPGGLFDGSEAWRLHFPAGQPIPVDSFWSLSLYEATDDGQFFFADNPIGRYAIGDRTPGLTYGEDGSLDIWIGHADPGPERRGAWLPAPAGPFALFMRAYLPKPELLEGRYRLPPVERV